MSKMEDLHRIVGVLLVLLFPISGHTTRDMHCGSYKALQEQYSSCANQSLSNEDEAKQNAILTSGMIGQSEVIEILKIACRSLVPSRREKSCFTIDCLSDTEMAKLLNKWGGFCDGNANLLQQVFQLLAGFQSVNVSYECSWWRWRKMSGCSDSANLNHPDSCFNIKDGINWWESTRKSFMNCVITALNTPPPTACGRIRENQIVTILYQIMRPRGPVGIGAYIDLGPFMDELSSD